MTVLLLLPLITTTNQPPRIDTTNPPLPTNPTSNPPLTSPPIDRSSWKV